MSRRALASAALVSGLAGVAVVAEAPAVVGATTSGPVDAVARTAAPSAVLVDAAPTTEVVQGRYLRLVSEAYWDAAAGMAVGSSVRWDLTVSAAAPSPGIVRIAVSADGSLPLELDARACAQPWSGETCATGVEPLREDWAPPLHGELVALTAMADTEVLHLRIDVRRAAGGDELAETSLRVQASGMGDEVAIGPGADELAGTGMSPIVLLVFGGLVALLLVCGILFCERARRRGRRDDEPGGGA